MSNGFVYLFPGQGTRYRGAALDFLDSGNRAAGELFDLAGSVVGMDMEALIRDADDATLKRTDVAQPAITLASLVAAVFLAERGFVAAACAGFSLGEYAAMTHAGVIGAEDCFRLIKARSVAMQKAADRLREAAGGDKAAAPGMSAVIGMAPEKAAGLIDGWREAGLELYAANFNSPAQLVVSGTAAALAEAETRFREAGARTVMRLNVAGPFHSPLLADVAGDFAPALEAVEFADPKIPFYSNVTGGRVESGAEAKRLALMQVTAPVRWVEEQAAVVSDLGPGDGIRACLEVGPGKVLRGFWRESGSVIPCHGAGTIADIEKIAAGGGTV